ncbi:MAG: hypothetical protein ACI4JF_01105 [Oscillospiraceae bacterium]
MTEKQLNQIYYLSKEKKMWEDKLKEMTEIKAVSYNNSGAGHSSDVSSPVVRLAEQREKIREIISAKLVEISYVEREILEYINTVSDSLVRQVMYKRHVELKSWPQVSKEIEGTTPDSLRMMEKRYIKEHL